MSSRIRSPHWAERRRRDVFGAQSPERPAGGTQSGQSFRLGGLGMPKLKGGGSGDLYARVKMTVPKDLSPREHDLLTELAKLRQDSVKV